ncbi:photosystem II S4 domain protein [Candidatus Synechococcus calcipolaris G9]|uniref:Photosystem II S4 domain protein n=1 Tax=Candidatus Synechococcus calcipolaris G9 TaxID=1497997 RepID=A0ABT6F375_9SYNE|nr:photosystem II S4 domain protein [Candidatus Synechococcus calcipolaris]MDG2992227.1 photosystem II S4 domain protein [Candidatus Synechococcus calcipolaris G9]
MIENDHAAKDELGFLSGAIAQAIKTWTVCYTPFLDPAVLAAAHSELDRLTEIHYQSFGGYPQAERCRLAIARRDIPLEGEPLPLGLLSIAGNFLFDPAQYRDFEQALLSSGTSPENFGDIILLGERGAQVILTPEAIAPLKATLHQVRTVPVTLQEIPWAELKVSPPQTKAIATVEASLRLDALGSAGFGLSRSKMVDLINQGDVRVNWQPIHQASHRLQAGDLLVVRGKGRVEIRSIQLTKKERYRVEMIRHR